MALAGPHIDGEHPAYPLDATVARDPEEARRAAERNIADGATALKIYFRLPLASAIAVVRVCRAHDVPCTAHLEILDARDLLLAGLDGLEHITSMGTSVVPFRPRRTVSTGGAGRQRCAAGWALRAVRRRRSWQAPRRDGCTRCSSGRIRSSIRPWPCSRYGPAARAQAASMLPRST
jgi:hypothetical protein